MAPEVYRSPQRTVQLSVVTPSPATGVPSAMAGWEHRAPTLASAEFPKTESPERRPSAFRTPPSAPTRRSGVSEPGRRDRQGWAACSGFAVCSALGAVDRETTSCGRTHLRFGLATLPPLAERTAIPLVHRELRERRGVARDRPSFPRTQNYSNRREKLVNIG